MKFILIFLLLSLNINLAHGSKNHNSDNREFYDNRAKFIKTYIEDLKKKKKLNSKFKGSVVETVWGKIYTRLGTDTQANVDKAALSDCRKDGGIDCLVRFRSLKKNPKYNRYAKYYSSKNSLKVLDEFIPSKKVYSTKGIDVLIATKDFQSKSKFTCLKSTSNFRDELNILRREIEIYPVSFLKNSGLKYVMICENISDSEVNPVGIAPGHFDQSPGVFYINISEVNSYKKKEKVGIIKHVFHHEFYHVIDAALTKIYVDDEWNKLNKQSYSDKLLIDRNVIDNSVKGYISKYARNNVAEDKAELFAFMISQHKKFKKTLANDEILLKKSKLMIKRLKGISKEIDKNFWRKLN